jgi:hypothetical protein
MGVSPKKEATPPFHGTPPMEGNLKIIETQCFASLQKTIMAPSPLEGEGWGEG